ncbi:hypothetical protein [Aeromicrobium sp.]|uniref:hypothetical protein n=1 Tax=Aeromicrobium sp. TaxID=1871063 RepID=UPI0030C439FE
MTSPSELSLEEQSRSVTALLRHFAWARVAARDGLYEVWRPEDDPTDDLEVVVPLDPNRGDFGALLQRAKSQVLRTYGESARQADELFILRSRASLDSTQWLKETPFDAGLIGWEEGERLYGAARATLVAAAKAAREPRKYHGNASAFVAKNFLEQSLMGQTEIGSFVVTAHTPAGRRFHLTKKSEDAALSKPRDTETRSGRDIIDVFERALEAVRGGLDEYRKAPRIEVFEELVDEGVSYELTKALAELSSNGDAGVEIVRHAFDGSPEIPPKTFHLTSEESQVLGHVATVFAEDPEPREVTLLGEVTFLSHSSDDPAHVIRLLVEDGADARMARVRLSADEYQQALEAHRRDARIRISGSLEREGNINWLYNARDLRVVPHTETDSMQQLGLFK